jgi:hypothetical protein
MKEDYFIGWSDETPKSYRKHALVFLSVSLLVLLSVGVLYVSNQRGFIDSYYDYGNIQEMSGYLVSEPVWGLRQESNGKTTTIPLVGYGKHGPHATITKMMEDHSLSEGTMVTLRGMIFQYQGRKWMELTEMENSLVSAGNTINLDRSIRTIGTKTYNGEIVDPKCFFGVMNPATKAVHRSCAIRCISGGIPPILVIRENGIPIDYCFLVDNQMQNLQMEVLPYVGIPVEVTGKEMLYDDWKVLQMDMGTLKMTKASVLDYPYVAVCN